MIEQHHECSIDGLGNSSITLRASWPPGPGGVVTQLQKYGFVAVKYGLQPRTGERG